METELKNLPLGIQNFESLIKDGYLYVDKTSLMYRLVTTGRYYFLSRPRRFGKSLLLSTLHSYFDGQIHKAGIPHRGHQVRQSHRVQRSE